MDSISHIPTHIESQATLILTNSNNSIIANSQFYELPKPLLASQDIEMAIEDDS